jgi:hypothetical protein
MKKLLTILIFVTLAVTVSAQGLLDKPSKYDFKVHKKAFEITKLATFSEDSTLASLNKWDLATGVTAVALNLKTGQFSGFSSAGFGVVRAWYKLKSDGVTVYKTFSAGGMLLFGDTKQDPLFNLSQSDATAEPPKTDVGIMGVVGIGPISAGPAYFIASKTFLLNFQAVFTF